MVSKLKSALLREKGVDIKAKKVKEHLKKVEKEKLKSNKKPRLEETGDLSSRKSEGKKLKHKAPALTSQSADNDEDDDEWEGLNEDDEDDEGEEDDEGDEDDEDEDEDDEEFESFSGTVIDTSRLEDDLSSDSESEEEQIMATPKIVAKKTEKKIATKPEHKKAEKKNAKSQKTQQAEEEDGIALSDLPSDSESGEDEDAADIVPYQRLTINNTKALAQSLSSIALPISSYAFVDHMTVTSTEPTTVADVDDDLNRELAFYNQALDAVNKGRSLLTKEKVPFSRPEDYFAEMVKSDVHMDKLARHYAAESAPKQRGAASKSKPRKKK